MSDIDWSSAEVRDGTLAVELTEKPGKEWGARLQEVVGRLGRDGVKLDKQRLTVEGVEPGREGDVRHVLESAVLQVNADLAPEEPEDEDAGDERSEADREMTQAFRAFAPGDAEG